MFGNAEPGTLDGIVPADGTGQVIITSLVLTTSTAARRPGTNRLAGDGP